MMRNIAVLVIILVVSNISYSKPKLTVSSEPLANILSLIIKDAEIEILTPLGFCPHEYILKPTDFKRAENSDFIIYVSDKFEPFVGHLIKNTNAQIIELGNDLKISSTSNMHIWMSLEYVRKTISIIAQKLKIPSQNALQKIDDMNSYRKSKLSHIKSVLLLSDSLEYLFEDIPSIYIEKLYIKPGMTSAKDLVTLRNQQSSICILINSEENITSIESKIGHKIVPIESESWSLEGYKKIIDDISDNCI